MPAADSARLTSTRGPAGGCCSPASAGAADDHRIDEVDERPLRSAAETTRVAEISEPSASATPVARPLRV